MRNLRVFICSVFLFVLTGARAAEREHPVQGYVIDNLTGENIPGATVVLMRADSSVVGTTTTLDYPEAPTYSGVYNFKVKQRGKYILKATCVGYEAGYQHFELRMNRQGAIIVKPIRLMKTVKELPEVVVRPTQLKMVYSGDTIIYNADAFKVAEGSMLNALIEQLPGVNISDEGVITVNGQYVQSLLLNGRDFFKGNPRLALENLPAYTVGRVKVYHKLGPASAVMQRSMNDGTYVMDVHLKKEYAVGYLGNAEAGIGTSKRYRAKGMGMKFSEVSRLVAYANLNNLNDNRRIGFSSDWKPGDMPKGLRTEQAVGGNYMYYIDKDSWFQTENSYSHACSDLQRRENSQTFLPEGDVTRMAYHNARNRHHNGSTRNTLTIQNNKLYSNSYLNVSLSDGQHTSTDTAETSRLATWLNRRLYQQKSNSRDFSFSAGTDNGIRIVVDMLRLKANVDYSRSEQNVFAVDNLSYSNKQMDDHRHTYRTSPNYRFGGGIGIGYDYIVGQSTFSPSYTYDYSYRRSTNERYRLDRLAEADSLGIDVLPSAMESMITVRDEPNSYIYRHRTNTHRLQMNYSWHFGIGHLVVNLPLRWSLNHLAAQRLGDHSVRRDVLFLEPELALNFYPPNGASYSLSMNYRMGLPNLTDMIDYRDDSDPLHIKTGNPLLRNTRHFNAATDFAKHWDKGRTVYAKANLNFAERSVAWGMEVDKQTGVAISRPENVDGNWGVSGEAGLTMPFGKKQKFTLDAVIRPSFRHNVDLAYVAGEEASRQSIVKHWRLSEELKLNYQPCKGLSFKAKAKAGWSRMDGTMAGFEQVNVWDVTMGLSAIADLPWKMQLTTDLTDYLRRGYRSSEMNTNELLWNVRLTKSILKGHLLFGLSAFDVLGQQKVVTYRLNEQGRTEAWTNTLPRYAMFSVSYNFHINPRRAQPSR